MTKVFIDGKEGTTGLKIASYLEKREDIALVTLPEEKRKDPESRRAVMGESAITILCLPDAAAIEAAELAEGTGTKLIDASTAHRTAPGWAYGFPELGIDFEAKIKAGNKAAVPGCHASGVLAIVYPLIKNGILSADYPLVCTSLTGYSGGGKKTIAEYEGEGRSALLDSPRLYAIGQNHKHLKEIISVAGLSNAPAFCPVIGDFFCGMEVMIPLHARLMQKRVSQAELLDFYKEYYKGQSLIRVTGTNEKDYRIGDYIASNALAGTDGMTIVIAGNENVLMPVAVYDNLRKGAAAAAVECLNLMLGEKKEKGLTE